MQLDPTLTIPGCPRYFQGVGCCPHIVAANGLSRPFRLGDFHILLRLSQLLLFHSKTSVSAESLSHSMQLVYRKDPAGVLQWSFAVMQLVFATLRH
jgi:hypothetical protein